MRYEYVICGTSTSHCSGGHLVRMFEPSLVLPAEVACLNLSTRVRFERGEGGRDNYKDDCT